MNDYTTLDVAAQRVSDGWTQGRWMDSRGNVCMIGAITEGENCVVHQELVRKIHQQLRRRWDYRVTLMASTIYHYAKQSPYHQQGAIQLWNDLPWRRKEQVVETLRAAAESERPAWLEDEVLRLSIEVSALREEIRELRVRLALVEAENQRLWRRVLGNTSLQADRDQLAELEEELTEKSRELGVLSDDAREEIKA